VDDGRDPLPDDYVAAQRQAIVGGRPGDAVSHFVRFWGMYAGALCEDDAALPAGRWASVKPISVSAIA
jgi:hypothetical protein